MFLSCIFLDDLYTVALFQYNLHFFSMSSSYSIFHLLASIFNIQKKILKCIIYMILTDNVLEADYVIETAGDFNCLIH